MNNKTPEAVLDKIKKCLMLAQGKNATPGEMEAALAAAKRIANQYNIEIANINLKEERSATAGMEIKHEHVKLRSRREQIYHRYIYLTLQEVFGIKVYSSRWGCAFIGEKTDVAICQVLFPWLEDLFYSTYYNAMKDRRLVSCAAHKRGVYAGLMRGLVWANRKEEEKQTAEEKQTMALVVRDKKQLIEAAAEEHYPKAKSRKALILSESQHAYQIGLRKGATIKLNQVGAGTAAPARQIS